MASLSSLIATTFARAANPPPPALTEPSSSTTSEDVSLTTLKLLEKAQQLANSLSVISENDQLTEITTPSLRVLFLDSLRGELELQVRTGLDHEERKRRIRASLASHRRFLTRVFDLNAISPPTRSLIVQQLASAKLVEEVQLANQQPSGSRLPPRELKIALFQLERSLQKSLDDFRSAYASSRRGMPPGPRDAFYDLLFTSDQKKAVTEDSDEDDDEEDGDDGRTRVAGASNVLTNVRQYLLLLLNLHAVKASSSVQSSAQELELLNSMPPPDPDAQVRDEARLQQDAEWRLDSSLATGKGYSGPLMDDKGKPLRPFTITSSSATPGLDKKQQIREGVFRPGHRLPTMSIDEYLEEEARRGNIIEGGGHEGAAQATPREARALRAENDGTREAEEAEEEARQEALHWDKFKEANRKGAGNTMNRG